MHDLGKVVLAKNFEDLYGRVLSLARKQPVALWDVEKEMFGANHGEIGGCLLGMWNMPGAIVDATALHHEPPLGEHNQLTALAAVHIANVLEREVWPSDDGMQVRPIISTPFLNQVGLLHRLPVWRAALANRRAVDLEPEPEARPAEPDQSPWTRSTTPAQSRTEGQTVSAAGFPWSSVWAGAAAVMGLVAFWFSTRPDVNNVELAYARTPSPYEARSVFSPIPVPQTAPAPATVQEKPSSPPAASETALKPTPSASTPAAVAATPTRTNETNGQPASVPLRKRPQPDFRFMGVIYTSNRPSAIVNGQTVNVGDHVDGATVLAISRNSVTLEIKGQRKLFELW